MECVVVPLPPANVNTSGVEKLIKDAIPEDAIVISVAVAVDAKKIQNLIIVYKRAD